MGKRALRRTATWTVGAHAIGGLALGAAEAVRLHSTSIAAVVVPLCGLVGMIAGGLVALTELGGLRIRGRLGPTSLAAELYAALVLALPSVIVTIPVARLLFQGPYARTLPLADEMPLILPAIAWLMIAAASVVGRSLVLDGAMVGRGVGLLGVASLLGGLIWAKHHMLGTGYQGAHVGAMVSAVVLAGVAVRLAIRVRLSLGAMIALGGFVSGAAIAAAAAGLTQPADRRLLADRGDLGRDVVHLARRLLDLDRDGTSRWLGGGDCDDMDPTRHPGARDIPGDGVDQDCDGIDAPLVAAVTPPSEPSAEEVAWDSSPAVQSVLAKTKHMNVLLITVDALRFDPLAPDDPHRSDFPRLAALLDSSAQFTRAIAPAAGTDVSLSTLLTGRFDPFQIVDRTLPEAVREIGHRTSQAMPAEVTRSVGETLLARGFDTTRVIYTDWAKENVGDHISSPTTTNEGIRAIDKANGKPWFTWVHYFDVHEHHQLTVPDDLMAAVFPGPNDKVHRYRALLRQVDISVGKLLDNLVEKGMMDNTIIVFVADHGESLGEDPRLPNTHGLFAYPALVRIPFAIHVPGIPGAVRTDPVSLVDVTPTILALLGNREAIKNLDGYSLVPVLLSGPAKLHPPASRPLVVHEEKQYAVVEWPYQLIVRPEDDLVELYDLDRDPGEHSDLSSVNSDVTARLKASYAEVPVVKIDRTAAGRAWRERQAQPPRSRARS